MMKNRSNTDTIKAKLAESEAGEAKALLIIYLRNLLAEYHLHYDKQFGDAEICQRMKTNSSVRKLIEKYYKIHCKERGRYFKQSLFMEVYAAVGLPYNATPCYQDLEYEQILKNCINNSYISPSCMPNNLRRKVLREKWEDRLAVDVPFRKLLVSRYGTSHRSRYELLLVNYFHLCHLDKGIDFQLDTKYPRTCNKASSKSLTCDITFPSSGKTIFCEVFMFNKEGLKEYIKNEAAPGMIKTVEVYLNKREVKEKFLFEDEDRSLMVIDVTNDHGKAFPHEVFLRSAIQKFLDAGILSGVELPPINSTLCSSLVKTAISLREEITGALKTLSALELGVDKRCFCDETWKKFAQNLIEGKKVCEAATIAGLDPLWFNGLCRLQNHKTACRGAWQIKSQLWEENYTVYDIQTKDDFALLITLPAVLTNLARLNIVISDKCSKLPAWIKDVIRAETRIPKSTGIYGLRINRKGKYIYLDPQRIGILHEYYGYNEMSQNLFECDQKVISDYLIGFIEASGRAILSDMKLDEAEELVYKNRGANNKSIVYYVLNPNSQSIDQISKRIHAEIRRTV